MTKLLIWACVLALTPVVAGLMIRFVAWARAKNHVHDVLVP